MCLRLHHSSFFFFNDTATTEIYTLSLHDALPICDVAIDMYLKSLERARRLFSRRDTRPKFTHATLAYPNLIDRKSTRLNSSHLVISYAVFCLKKKNKTYYTIPFYTVNFRTHQTRC